MGSIYTPYRPERYTIKKYLGLRMNITNKYQWGKVYDYKFYKSIYPSK